MLRDGDRCQIMTRRVVVGFDGSPAAAVALVWATREATLRAAELVVITVLERRDPHHDVDPAKTLAAQLLKESLTGGYPVSVREFRGDAATELVGACTDTDLLVVGSRGRGPLAGLMPGSVSRACLSHAPCPVVVVPARPTRAAPRHRVMVGVDGSGHSRAALSAAAEEARLRGASLDIVHVVHWDNIGTELLTPEVDQLVEWGVKLVDDEVAATGVAGRHLIVHDNPSRCAGAGQRRRRSARPGRPRTPWRRRPAAGLDQRTLRPARALSGDGHSCRRRPAARPAGPACRAKPGDVMTASLSSSTSSVPNGHHGLAAHEVVLLLETDPHRGLTGQEAAERLARFGPNTLARGQGRGAAGADPAPVPPPADLRAARRRRDHRRRWGSTSTRR